MSTDDARAEHVLVTRRQLDALPVGARVQDDHGITLVRRENGWAVTKTGGWLPRRYTSAEALKGADGRLTVLSATGAAGRAETTVIHLSSPDDGASFCDQPVTIITEAGDTRPVWQIVTEVQAQRDALAARLAAVEAAFEDLPIFLHAIEKDQRRTPKGRGGEAHFIPATPGHGKSGCPGDNITRWLNEVRAALSAAPTDTTKETDR